MKKITALLLAFLAVGPAFAESTINPNVPAQNSQLNSAPLRQNFGAAYNDINNLTGLYPGNSSPLNPSVGQYWRNTGVTPQTIWIWDGVQWDKVATWDTGAHQYTPFFGNALLTWQQLLSNNLGTVGQCLVSTGAVPVMGACINSGSVAATAPITATFGGTTATIGINLDSNFAVSANKLAFAPIAAGAVIGNATGASAEPTAATLTSLFDVAFSATQGSTLYRGSTSWLAAAPGLQNQLWVTGGAAANPSWANITSLLTQGTGITISGAQNATIALTNQITAGGPTGNANTIPVITYNAQGQLTAVTTATVTPASIGGVPATRTIATTAPLTGGGDLSADRTFAIANNGISYALFVQPAANSLVGNPTGSAANATNVTLGATLGFSAGVLQTGAGTGDVTWAANSFSTTIANNAVTYGKFQQVAASSLVGNPTGSLANAQGITLGATLAFSGTALQTGAITGDVTAAANSFATTLATVNSNVGSFGSATSCPTFTVNAKGLITAASATTCTPSLSNITGTVQASQFPVLTGDVTTPGASLTTTIASGAVTNAKLASVTGPALKGNINTTPGSPTDIVINSLTQSTVPDATNDMILIWDNASNSYKRINPATIASSAVAGVSSLGGVTGAIAVSSELNVTGSTLGITAAGVTYAMVQNGTGLSVLGRSANSGGVNADIVAGSDGQTLRRNGTSIGFGALNLASANAVTGTLPSSNLDAATANDFRAGTSGKVLTASAVFTTETTTTYGTTTAFDFSTFVNTAVTLTGNITTMNVSNIKAGQAGTITFIQDSTGSRTTVWNSAFKFAGGSAPTLSTAANAVDVLTYACRTTTFCTANLLKAVN